MPLDFVPIQHVLHLIGRLPQSEAEREQLIAKAEFGGAQLREVFEVLEAHDAGTLERLEHLWPFPGKRSLLLWSVPALVKNKPCELISKRLNGRATEVASDQFLFGDFGLNEKGDRIIEVKPSEAELFAKIRLKQTRSFVYEGKRKTEDASEDVLVSISFSRNTPVVQVYAGYQNARRSLFTLLDWLLGYEVPRRKCKQQESLLTAVDFNQRDIAALIKKHNLPIVSERATDPTGKVGELQKWGLRDGSGKLNPLAEDELVSEENCESKSEQWVNVRLAHEDGFIEEAVTRFQFQKAQGHITFQNRASVLVTEHVISTLLEGLRLQGGPSG